MTRNIFVPFLLAFVLSSISVGAQAESPAGCYFESRQGEFMGGGYEEFELLLIEPSGENLLLRGIQAGWHVCGVFMPESGAPLLLKPEGTDYVYRDRDGEIACELRLTSHETGFELDDVDFQCKILFECGANAGANFSWRYDQRLPVTDACDERLAPRR